MKITVYTSPNSYPKEAQWLNEMLLSGLDYLHVYKPNWNKKQVVQLLDEIDFDFYNRIIVHAFTDIADDQPVHGFHFSQKFLNSMKRPQALLKMNELESYGHKLSMSVHDFNEYDTDFFDYAQRIIFSPVYPSLSKENHKPIKEVSSYRPFIQSHTEKEFVALGGVTIEKLEELSAIGFNSAAFLGYIWQEGDDPLAQFLNIAEHGCHK